MDARAPQSGPSALYLAAENNALRAAEALLQYGATVELGNKGATPLRAAADRGFEKMVTLLLDHGANVNTQDDLNRTPLMSAAKKG
ncbi:ankyrin repeat domain-containing protein, partial [Citrobacter sp. AAK_AS5]